MVKTMPDQFPAPNSGSVRKFRKYRQPGRAHQQKIFKKTSIYWLKVDIAILNRNELLKRRSFLSI
jgi:hypothetical protein